MGYNIKKFKITVPPGYLGTDILNDYIDINIIFETGEIYYGGLVTIENAKMYLDRGDLYFWVTDMLILDNLKKTTIRNAIEDIISKGLLDYVFDQIDFNLERYSKAIDIEDER